MAAEGVFVLIAVAEVAKQPGGLAKAGGDKMSTYKTLGSGKATNLSYVKPRGYSKGAVMKIACCDCGLVHTLVIFPLKTRVKVYFYRDNKATANVRRRKEPFKKK